MQYAVKKNASTMRQRPLRVGLALGLAAGAGLFLRSGSGGRLLGTMALASTATASYDWVQFDFDAQHSGNNTPEPPTTPPNARPLRPLLQVRLPPLPTSAPLPLS